MFNTSQDCDFLGMMPTDHTYFLGPNSQTISPSTSISTTFSITSSGNKAGRQPIREHILEKCLLSMIIENNKKDVYILLSIFIHV